MCSGLRGARSWGPHGGTAVTASANEESLRVTWTSDAELVLDGQRFALLDPAAAGVGAVGAEDLVLFKPRGYIEEYLRIAGAPVDAIVELGIYRGGSTAFLLGLFRPRAMLAVDLEPRLPRPLLDRLASHPLGGGVHVRGGVDQADRATIVGLVDELIGAPLDLVVDDASHLLGPTTVSFDTLFPRVRPGGTYVIEDWSYRLLLHREMERGWVGTESADAAAGGRVDSELVRAAVASREVFARLWAHDPGAVARALRDDEQVCRALTDAHPDLVEEVLAWTDVDDDPVPVSSPASDPMDLTPLIAHLVTAAATRPDVVASVRVLDGMAFVRRGPASLDPDDFDVSTLVPSSLRRSLVDLADT